MRARMLVDARVVREVVKGQPPMETASGESLKEFKVGQEIEGADAEFQVGLGHAEALPEPIPEVVERPKKTGAKESA